MVGREGGYIKLHRQIESWPLWKSMPVGQRMVWVQLLICANWKTDVMWFGAERVTVERGTLAHSEAEIARRAGVGRQVVRDALAKLLREGAITRQKSLPGNHAPWLVTIVNYERFQGNDETENPRPQLPGTGREPTENQRGTPREEGEEGKKVKALPTFAARVEQTCPNVVSLLKRAAEAGFDINLPVRDMPTIGGAEALIISAGLDAATAAVVEAARRRNGGNVVPLAYLMGPLRDAGARRASANDRGRQQPGQDWTATITR